MKREEGEKDYTKIRIYKVGELYLLFKPLVACATNRVRSAIACGRVHWSFLEDHP